ncbi:hypothetical protein [Bacteroides sp. 224]|uniref:hypothetical protein n=1 Tax=Bacteroides sp. 224 TaxID=2302936 RepID=UPI0013D6B112|nr:hypothetical protein [Bacteroides sp. 224]NDV66663.1 hypothetical protein [Bacteroides sp. 224]
MKKLICPYTWFCGEEFEAQDMSEYDYKFLQSAITKGMTFMFIHCPKCSTQFRFNPVEWKAEAAFSDPNKKAAKELKPTTELLATLEKQNIKIPPSYLDYLTSKTFKPNVSIVRGQSKFHLYNLNELCETVSIDGNSCLRITSLKAYAKSLEEVFGEENTETFSLAQLSNCLTIGCENEAVLFIDYRDNNSLWIFHPDGGDIEPTKMTVEKIVKRK